MNSLLALVAALLLAGCASSGPLSILPDVPPDQAGTIVVARNNNLIGAAIAYIVSLDGVRVLAITVGQYARLPVRAGDHMISVGCGGISESGVRVTVAPGAERYVVLSPNVTSCADMDLVPEAEGRAFIADRTRIEMSRP